MPTPLRRPKLPRVIVGGETYVAQSWSGIGALDCHPLRSGPPSPYLKARGLGSYGVPFVFEPTFAVVGDHVLLHSIEKSPNYGYRTREEAGEVRSPVPFTGRLLVSFTPTPQSQSEHPDWLSFAWREGREDIVLATDIRVVEFTNGSLIAMRAVTEDFGRMLELLRSKSDRNLASMRALLEQTPIRRREARALLEAFRQDAATAYRNWAEDSSVGADCRLEGPATVVAVGRADDLFRKADRRAWSERTRAERGVDGPRLVEASQQLLEVAAASEPRASRVAGCCPRCDKSAELRVCRHEGFVLCDECWLVWW